MSNPFRVKLDPSKGAASIEVSVTYSASVGNFGCHAYYINSLTVGVPRPPELAGIGETKALGKPKFGSGGYSGLAALRVVMPAGIVIPHGITDEEYQRQVKEAFPIAAEVPKLDSVSQMYSGRRVLDCVSKEFKKEIFEKLFENLLPKQTNGYYNTVVFAPVLNHGYKTRSDGEIDYGYQTPDFIEWLMENKGGSWFGTPVMRNKAHTRKLGGDLSLFQVITWNMDPEEGEIFRNSRFELHPKGGKMVALKDFLLDERSKTGSLVCPGAGNVLYGERK